MKFEQWLQERLNAHGADPSLDPDGDWGRASIDALTAFQQRKRLDVTGVADTATVEALRKEPGSRSATVEAPEEQMPPWMSELHRRMGLNEVQNNATLIEFLRIGRYLGNPKDNPWCGDAIESAMAKVLPGEKLPSNPFFAQAWANFGVDCKGPVIGAIGVIRWTASSGHVGTVAGVTPGRVILLGGNQTNAINLSSFPESKFIAFRWPSTFPFKVYPPLKGDAPRISFKGTR